MRVRSGAFIAIARCAYALGGGMAAPRPSSMAADSRWGLSWPDAARSGGLPSGRPWLAQARRERRDGKVVARRRCTRPAPAHGAHAGLTDAARAVLPLPFEAARRRRVPVSTAWPRSMAVVARHGPPSSRQGGDRVVALPRRSPPHQWEAARRRPRPARRRPPPPRPASAGGGAANAHFRAGHFRVVSRASGGVRAGASAPRLRGPLRPRAAVPRPAASARNAFRPPRRLNACLRAKK